VSCGEMADCYDISMLASSLGIDAVELPKRALIPDDVVMVPVYKASIPPGALLE
jgi:hypothetical protein